MKEIEFSRWLFELPAKQHSQFSPSGSPFLPCLSLPSKYHREISISSIFLESPHKIDMKNVVKSSKHFFGYFNSTLKTHSVMYENIIQKEMNKFFIYLPNITDTKSTVTLVLMVVVCFCAFFLVFCWDNVQAFIYFGQGLFGANSGIISSFSFYIHTLFKCIFVSNIFLRISQVNCWIF